MNGIAGTALSTNDRLIAMVEPRSESPNHFLVEIDNEVQRFSSDVNLGGNIFAKSKNGGKTYRVDVVRNQFLVDNIGSGNPTSATVDIYKNLRDRNINVAAEFQNLSQNYPSLISIVKQAHKDGWTGNNLRIDLARGLNAASFSDDPLDKARLIAPQAAQIMYGDTFAVHNKSSQATVNQTYGSSDLEHILNTGAYALVWHKHGNLTGSQLKLLMDETSVGGKIRLDRALSPVGNLR